MSLRTLTTLFRTTTTTTPIRTLTTTSRKMGVTKTILVEGSGASPQKGDTVTMLYTGWLKEAGKKDGKGKQFDTTEKPGRGPFKTPIGVGRVIKGALLLLLHCKEHVLTSSRLGRGRRADEARREGQAGHQL